MDSFAKRDSAPPHGPVSPARKLLHVIDSEGRLDPELDPRLDSPQLRRICSDTALVQRIYEAMLRTRLLDARLLKLQRQGRIGFHIGSEGEEAAIIGSAAALRDQDWIFPCYREVGAALYRGLPLQVYVDNMFGNADDHVKGRQMPDHLTARAVNFGSITSPIGTQITQAAGFAWAKKLQQEDVVTACYFGDGATSSNDFHAGLNFAGVYQLPVLFLLRNNGWAISLPSEQQTHAKTYADKGSAYGVPAVRCDGNDALAVYAVTRSALERARHGEGPTLIELVTYRQGPHSSSDDPSAYRDNALVVEEQARRDPLRRLRAYLEHRGGWSTAEQTALEERVQAELAACIERAEHTRPPDVASLFEDVYAEMPAHLREQQAECVNGPRPKQH
jgi:pyruvate dehydrogenase E1 component alpha subunit